MKIAHVTSELCRASAGLGAAVAAISTATQKDGAEVRVFGLSSPGWNNGDKESWAGADAEVFETTSWFGAFGYAPDMLSSLSKFAPDIVHLHGLWTFPTIAAYRCSAAMVCPLVISAHGMLTPIALSYSQKRKRLARWLYLDRVLRAAQVLHATSADEEESFRLLGLRNPVEIIPLGMDVLPIPVLSSEPVRRRVLFLGRLHHKKGIDWLVEAWMQLEKEFPDWELSIVGPEEPSYAAEIERFKRITIGRRVSFLAPMYGEQKFQFMAASHLFVLPSRSENFGLTVTESLSMGVPVIATKGTPWSALVENNAGWWVDPGADALKSAMRAALSMADTDLRAMGNNGRRWIEQDFSWCLIGEKWQRVYQGLMAATEMQEEPPLAASAPGQ